MGQKKQRTKLVRKKELELKNLLSVFGQNKSRGETLLKQISEKAEWSWANNDANTKDLTDAMDRQEAVGGTDDVAPFIVEDFGTVKASIAGTEWTRALIRAHDAPKPVVTQLQKEAACIHEMHEARKTKK
eukprot:3880370-Pyramimonas_sp.AAC.1